MNKRAAGRGKRDRRKKRREKQALKTRDSRDTAARGHRRPGGKNPHAGAAPAEAELIHIGMLGFTDCGIALSSRERVLLAANRGAVTCPACKE